MLDLIKMESHDRTDPPEMPDIDDDQAKNYFMLEIESEAKIRAVKHIKGLLRKPDQIEKV